MHHENTNLLNEVSKASKMGIDAINILLPKIKKEDLKKELKDQCSEYQKLQAKANEAMSEDNVTPSKEKMMEQTMLWGSIQMNTLLDSSEQHIAEMMINGTTMGIIDMTKKLNELESDLTFKMGNYSSKSAVDFGSRFLTGLKGVGLS